MSSYDNLLEIVGLLEQAGILAYPQVRLSLIHRGTWLLVWISGNQEIKGKVVKMAPLRNRQGDKIVYEGKIENGLIENVFQRACASLRGQIADAYGRDLE